MKKTFAPAKKLLSVFLSVLMLLTSLSVAFTAFAAETDDPIEALAFALKSETVKNLSSFTVVTNTSTGSGENAVKTNTATITLETYAEYKEISALLETLDAAVKASKEYTDKASLSNHSEAMVCATAGTIRDKLAESLLDSGYITAQEYADYNVATFLGNVFSMEQVSYTHSNSTSTKSNVPSRVYDVTVVTTNDYQGYLAEKHSYSEVEAAIPLGASYTIPMSRESYSISSGCGSTDYYHTAINTANGVPSTAYDGNNNTEVKQTLDAYNAYLDTVDFSITYEDMLDRVLAGTMEAFYAEFKAQYDAIVAYVGGAAVFNQLFSDRASAVENMLKSCASAMDVETYLAIAEEWKAFANANPDYGVFQYGAFEYDSMAAAYHEFVQIYNQLADGGEELLTYLNKNGNIRLDYYNNFTDNVVVYDLAALKEKADELYSQNKDTYPDLTTEEQTAVFSLLKGYLAAVDTYSDQVVSAIFPNGYEYLTALYEELYCATNEYVVYFANVLGTSYIDAATDSIVSEIETARIQLSGLNDFYASLAESLGAARADELLAGFVSQAQAFEAALLQLLADRFTAEVEYADSVYQTLGEPTEVENIPTYIKLKAAFASLEGGILTYLTDENALSYLTQETIDTYNALYEKIYSKWVAFGETYGFSAYTQTQLTYPSREPYASDQVKTDSYDVTEEALNHIIEKLDEFLTSESFTDLTGIHLADTLTNAVKNALFTDSFINTVVNLLYPLVLGEFEKVWSDLPTTVDYEGNNLTVTYQKTLYTILGECGLNLSPQLLGESLPASYAEAKQALIAANQSWTSSAVYDKTTGALTLSWGVDKAAEEEKEAVFYQAFADALSGLKPLIMALLCNQDWTATSSNIATTKLIITIYVSLTLTASGNDGYVNALGPVFEALGCETIPTQQEMASYTDLKDVAKAIFNPIFDWIAKVGEKPVDTILSILPNVIYALSFDMVTPILSMLKTTIGYEANATIAGTVKKDGVDIDVGAMLNLEDMGLDLSKGLTGILELAGISLPEIDEATAATLGELTTIDTVRTDWVYDNTAIGSKAYTIQADKADVAYYVLMYAVELLKDSDALSALLAKFLDDDQIDSVLSVIRSLNLADTGDVIAALTELINPEKYAQAAFVYPAVDETDSGETIVSEDSCFYSLYWTKPQAQYVADNLIPFVEKICDLFGLDITGELNNLLSTLYTKENVAAITELLNNWLSGGTVRQVIDVLSPIANMDISAILMQLSEYEIPDFEDGDEEAFIQALVDYVLPLVPVLKLFIADGYTFELLGGLASAYSYNGYNSAVIPVLEAIGCSASSLTPYDTFRTLDDEAMVRAVFDPIFELIDETIANDPIHSILALLPNILYFIQINGLQQAVENLLRPLYIVFDTIRPIYDVRLTINLNLEELLTDALASLTDGLSIKFPGYSELSTMLMSLGTVTTYTSVTGGKAVRLTVNDSLTPEFITVLLRTVVKTVLFSNNSDEIMNAVQASENLSDAAKQDIANLLETLKNLVTDQALFVLFYAFFGLNTGVNGLLALRELIAGELLAAFQNVGFSTSEEFKEYVKNISDILLSITGSADDLLGNTSENSLTAFFKRLFDFFQTLLKKFLAIFKL